MKVSLMMNKITFFICLILITTTSLFSFDITGRITDESKKIAIENAAIILLEKDLIRYSDPQGRFVFKNIKEGSYTLIISMPGFKEERIFFKLSVNLNFNIKLSREVIKMNTIQITAEKTKKEKADTEDDYSKEEIEKVPVFSDPFNVIGRDSEVVDTGIFNNNTDSVFTGELPSNQFGNGRLPKQFSVAGGEPDWNNYYYDYIQLPYTVHLTGPGRSIFPLEVINSVKTYKGISPLLYGPGIGGTFVSEPVSTNLSISMVKLSVSSSYVNLFSQTSFGNSLFLITSLRHSIVEFTGNYMDIKREDTVYYPPLTKDLMPTIPERNGDFLTRLIFSIPANKFIFDILGFYDFSESAGGSSVTFDKNHKIIASGEDTGSLFSFLSYAGAAGGKWTFSPNDKYLNSFYLYSTYFSINYKDDAWDDTLSKFTPFRYRGISNLSFSAGNDLKFIISNIIDWNIGAKLTYTNITGYFNSWLVKDYPVTFFYDADDNPVFAFIIDTNGNVIPNPYDKPWELHYILDENGLPILAKGDYLISSGDIFQFRKTYRHFFPVIYSKAELKVNNFFLNFGIGYDWFIEDKTINGYVSIESECSYSFRKDIKIGLRTGLSPGKYNEIQFTGRRLNEQYYGITPKTSFLSPPKAFTLQPFIKYGNTEYLVLAFKPYFNWYYNLSGFSLQTNYRNDADFTSPVTFLSPLQGLSFGATIDSKIKLNDYFFNRTSYTLSWSLYDVKELGWIYANTDVRHILKTSLYVEPGWGLIFGATLGVYIGTAFTPYTVTNVDPIETEPSLINSARDYVPKWYLRTQLKEKIKVFGGTWSAYFNTYNLLSFIKQKIFGFKGPVKIGDSTKDFKNRYYRNERDISGIFEIIEIGLSFKYKY